MTLESGSPTRRTPPARHDLYLLDDPWVPQFGAADVLEDLGAGGIDGANSDWIGPFIDMGFWPPRQGPRVKGFESATPKLIAVPFVGDLQTLTIGTSLHGRRAGDVGRADRQGQGRRRGRHDQIPVVFRGVSGNPIVTSWYPVFLSFGGEFFDDKWNVTFHLSSKNCPPNDRKTGTSSSRSGCR